MLPVLARLNSGFDFATAHIQIIEATSNLRAFKNRIIGDGFCSDFR